MKTIDEHLSPNAHLPLPITVWQVFDDVEIIGKNLKFRLRMGVVFAILTIGWWIYQADAPIFLLVAFSLFYLPSYWFYFFHYRHFNLKANTPLPVITISNHSVQLYDNNGQMMIDNNLVGYYNSKIRIWADLRWLVVEIKSQTFRYFLFDNFLFSHKLCHYYLNIDNEKYEINKEKLKNLIESIIIEVKKNPNCEFIEFNKRYYVNGR